VRFEYLKVGHAAESAWAVLKDSRAGVRQVEINQLNLSAWLLAKNVIDTTTECKQARFECSFEIVYAMQLC